MTQEQLSIENKRLKMQLLAANNQLREIDRLAGNHGAPCGTVIERAKYLFELLGW